MSRSTKEPDDTPDPSTLPIDMGVVTALIKGLAAAEQFSTRVTQDVPGMEEFDTDDWIGWRATATFAPVDFTTLTKDKREYYTPPPTVARDRVQGAG